jgi:leader peptidase (prepilin peptidase)/N-methyltransferase
LVVILLAPWAKVLAFFWGAIWGSFANVVIYRVPREMSVIRQRSRCGSCERPISAWDNIPLVSYLWLRGKCRHCGATFGLRYLVVEAIAGVLAFALYIQLVVGPLVAGGAPALVAWFSWFAFGLALIIVTYVDLDAWIVPDVVVLPMAVVGLVLAAIDDSWLGVPLPEALTAAVAGWGTFFAIHLFYKKVRGIDGLGLGDAKLLLMVGAFCGMPGLAWCIGAGAIQGLLISVPMVLMGRQVANTSLADAHGDDPEIAEDEHAPVTGRRVPFGPFLALAAIEYVLLRETIDGAIAWLAGVG